MPTELGQRIRSKRKDLEIGVRELARRIEKSPSFIVRIEKGDASVAEETLVHIAEELDLDSDELLLLAGKTPSDVRPETPYEVRLFRKMKELSEDQREDLFHSLDEDIEDSDSED